MTVEELEVTIRRYQEAYYSGEGEISDAEFDALWDELKKRAPESRVLADVGPERAAGDADGFPKAEHVIPMGSQEKAANEEEFRAWAEKQKIKVFIVQFKLDGAGLELQYEKGRFVRAVTRGDGHIGADITPNARRMRGVPDKLPKSDWTGGVRGEVLLFRDVWQKKYSDKANCRNAANGVMRRKDGEGSEDLTLICYDASVPGNENFFSDENGKIEWLNKAGFLTTPSVECANAEAVIKYRTKIAAKRAALEYDIDGLVVKDRETNMNDLRKRRPERQIAFKFDLERAESTLRGIEWSESGATYTPIGIIDPVRLAGTTVSRANLNNPATIRAMGLETGSRVIVVKRGEIIPKIEGVVSRNNSGGLFAVEQPSECGVCGTALLDIGTRLYCPNPACPKRVLHRLEKWVSVTGIAELGEKLLRQLFEKGRVRSVAGLFTLTREELAGYERMGDLSAAKVVRNIRAKRELSLAAFIAGFDIEGVGETIMEKITGAGFNTLEKIRSATCEEIAGIYGLGEITARVIVDGLAETKDDMDAVLAAGAVTIADASDAAALPLAGFSFCFTGELNTMKRSEAEALVKNSGGTTKSSVAGGLSYLVTNDPESGSAKNAKARKLGVAIIDEAAFLNLLSRS